MLGMGGHHRGHKGETNEWFTPSWLFERLGLTFDLDPCTAPGGVEWIPATRHFSIEDNGLAQKWDGRVWLNPPYGPDTIAWLHRLAEHGNGIGLVFARTDTAWWHRSVPRATAVCLLEGRITFVRPDGTPAKHNSGAPSALVAFGVRNAEAVATAGLGMTFSIKRGLYTGGVRA